MNNHKKIFFRADAGTTIGYGHFIRTLALADMLKNDFDCTFFTQTPTEYQRNEAKNICPLIALPHDETKFALFLDYLTGDEIVVLDNYFFTTDYQRAIKAKGCTLVCIDDMHDKHYVADVVINHGADNPKLFDIEPYTKLCLGLNWALLRKPFLEAAKNIKSRSQKEKIENVVVCFGGSDINDLTGKYIDILLQNIQVQSITAVVGDAYQPQNGKKENKKVRYRSRLSAQEMADLFCKTDCVVCSASTTCIEALACGTKVAAGWYVENQKEIYRELMYTDNFIGLDNLSENSLVNFGTQLIESECTYRLDFGSAHYVSLFEAISDKCYLRQARCSDVDIIFNWANDKEVRINSFKTDVINYHDHLKWYKNTIINPNISLFILFFHGTAAGMARYNIEDTTAVISYSIANEFRGRGLGNRIIKLVENEIQEDLSLQEIAAFVKPENDRSRKIFVKLGYIESFDEQEKAYKYIKNIHHYE